MGKIAFLRPVLRKSREFSRCFRTDKNSLRQPPYRKNYQQNHTPESVAEFLRGGAILRSNGSVVEKCDVIEIVEITPTRQTVIIQDPARHERIQRTHLENRRALQRQRFVAQDHLRDIGSRSKRSKRPSSSSAACMTTHRLSKSRRPLRSSHFSLASSKER